MTQRQKLAIIGGTLAALAMLCIGAYALATFFARNTGGLVVSGAGPQVLVKSPPQGAMLPINQDVQVQISASDPNGVVRVELYVNGALSASESSPNLLGLQSFSPSLRWRPTTPGSYSLQARGIDSNNVTGESTVIQVTALADITPVPTATPTATPTNTPLPPSPAPALPTSTPVPPSPTSPGVPPTPTPVPPTATNTGLPPSSTQVLNEVAIDGNASGQVAAACPSGTRVTGGGFDGDAGLTITGSAMQANGWQVSAHNNTHGAIQLTARAICVSNIGGETTQTSGQASVQPHATGAVTAACATGSTLTGGGFGSTAQQEVLTSMNSGNGWQAVSRIISTSPQALSAYAVCYAGAGARTTVVSKQGELRGSGTATVRADCPTDKIVTGGGFSAAGELVITSSAKSNNGWQVSAANALRTGQLLTAVAVCTGF